MRRNIALLLTLGLLSVNVPSFADASVDALVSQSVNQINWSQSVNEFGVWSFYASSGFWDSESGNVPEVTSAGVVAPNGKTLTGSGIVHDAYKYGDLSNAAYCTPVKSSWLDGATEATTLDEIDHNGIRLGLDDESKSLILINPNSYDNRVRFWLDEAKNTQSRKGDMIVCFTVPEDGVYKIQHDFVNIGTGATGGDGGVVRRTILEGSDTMETSSNSKDFTFTTDAPSVESKKAELFEGDKVYIRVSVGANAVNDNFYGKIIIDRMESRDSNVVLETYDVSKVSMSTAGNWSFRNSLPENTDYSKYHHMFPYERSTRYDAYSSGLNGKKYSTYVQVKKAPYIKWERQNALYAELKSGSSSGTPFLIKASPLIVWTAPEDGLYSLDLGLDETSCESGTKIIVSHLAAGQKNDTNIIKTINFPLPSDATEREAALTEVGRRMNKNDKLIIRFERYNINNVIVADATFKVNPSVRTIMENFESTYFTVDNIDTPEESENEITNLNSIQAGDVVRIKLVGDNVLATSTDMQAYACLYSNGKLVATYTTPSFEVSGYAPASAEIDCVIPDGVTSPEFRTYVWTDFNKAAPLCNEIYFN